MQRIRLIHLKPDQVLDQCLFSGTGQKLLNAGVRINQRHITLLQRSGEIEAILADSIDELVEAGVVKSLDNSKLSVGQKVAGGLMTRTGQVIVEAGEKLEEHHLEAIGKAGGKAFVTQGDDDKQSRRERILLGDALVEQLEMDAASLNRRVNPAAQAPWIRQAPADAWPAPDKLIAVRAGHVDDLRQYYARIEAGLPVEARSFMSIIDTLARLACEHPSRFTQLALLCPRREDYLPDHAYTVTVLAMAIGAQLKWPLEHMKMMGLAGLVYDLGMLLVPERIRTGAEQLTEIDRGRVQRHPVFTLAMLEAVEGVPLIVKLAAYQHHERENGGGYPRGTRREQVCDYARVLAVADSFAAATEPRTYRKPKLPYIAMEETLRSTATMVFWKPAARALVQAAGLFPVGSYVKLSDSTNAHVISANAKMMDRPTVQPLDADGNAKGDAIDLAEVNKQALTVVRPISGPLG
jgi:HD-GYP domain-containing protein (c-di-GMP phosphodiesterase class II)